MARLLPAVAVLLLTALPARAGLDPETQSPYKLRVVLHVADHRQLTPTFRDQVRRELHDGLQGALGDLAQVDVVTSDPLLKEVVDKGLRYALDGWKFTSDTKLHFVFIDLKNGYEIQARQYDGTAGLAGPVVRVQTTNDPLLVARTAAILVHEDFGLVGTVTRNENERVELAIKGGGLVPSLERWVKKDDVFAVTGIIDQAVGQKADRVPWTLLQVAEAPKNGVCVCHLYSRYQDPLAPGPGVQGYRALKLGTVRGPVQVRVVSDDRLGTPQIGKQVQLSAQGFQAAPLEEKATDNDGVVRSSQPYNNVVFVRVLEQGQQYLTRFPVELIEGRRTVVLPVSVRKDLAQRGEFEARKQRWLSRVTDGLLMTAAVVDELNSLSKQSREDALARARAAVKQLQGLLGQLTQEREALQKLAEEKKLPLELGDGDARLKALETRRNEFEDYLAKMEKIAQTETDPRQKDLKQLVLQAEQMEREADFGRAIATYERVLAEGGQDQGVRDRLERLKQQWALKGDEHQKARNFLYNDWPQSASAREMQARLPRAREAYEICKGVGDALTPLKLLKVNVALAAKLERENEALRPDEREDDRKTAETIKAVAGDLAKLTNDAREFVKKSTPAK